MFQLFHDKIYEEMTDPFATLPSFDLTEHDGIPFFSDAHCHAASLKPFLPPASAFDASAAPSARILRIHALTAPGERAVTDGSDFSKTLFSAGIHPSPEFSAVRVPEEFNTLWTDPHCVAIGECGFDRPSSFDSKEQRKLFERQIEVAETLGKALVIHSVRAHGELLRIRKAHRNVIPWILHGFRGNERKCMELLDAGFVLSFGDGLLRDAGNMDSFFSRIPLDCMLLESDTSPDSLFAVYALAASLSGLSLPLFRSRINQNFKRFFSL